MNRVVIMAALLLVAGLSYPDDPQETGSALVFVPVEQFEEITLDATLPVFPGEEIVELDAQKSKCKSGVCLAMGDCSGGCHSSWQPLPGDESGPGIWSWSGTCYPDKVCVEDETLPNSSVELKAFCGCKYDKEKCAPDFRYVGTGNRSDGSLFYKAVKLPAIQGEPKHCK